MAFEEFTSQGKVNAEQIEEARSVITPQGAVTGQAGQWEVRYPDGDVRVLDSEAFQYEWGGGLEDSESGESNKPATAAEKSLTTRATANAESDTGTRDRDAQGTTDDADSESDTSQDSDSEPTPSKRRSRSKDEESE